MEYIFYHMGEGLPFSEAVGSAIDQDFAELDVREDLRS
jgi:homoserine dehydrogenase